MRRFRFETLFLKWAGTGKPVPDAEGNPKRDAAGEVLIDLGELRNRNAANDRGMVRKHLIPRFGRMTLEQISLREVMEWLREMRDAKILSPQTQRHAFATLSRFWGWCVLWNHTTLPNPCRSVPTEIKPVVVHKKRATLEDDRKLAELIAALPDPVNIMLALANRTGLRLGEVCGLRLGDLDTIPKGFITVSHSYANPLKEDRRGVGRVKKAPAPVDVAAALKMHVARRRLQGAGPGDLLFVPTKTSKRPRAKTGAASERRTSATCGGWRARRRSSWTTTASRPSPGTAARARHRARAPRRPTFRSSRSRRASVTPRPRSPKSTTSSFSARTSTRR